MPITFDINKDGLYLEGKADGKMEGREESQFRMISRALKLGVLTVEQIAEMAEVSVDDVIKIKGQQ